MTSIRVEGASELIRRLESLQQMRNVKNAVIEASYDLKGRIAEYPPRSSRPNWMLRGNSDKAKRMRAGFFYRLNKKLIKIPYQRNTSPGSEKLGARWAVSTQNQGWRGVIGNNASYARLVQDSDKQTGYHRGTGWITTNQVVQLYGQDAIRIIRTALLQEVENG